MEYKNDKYQLHCPRCNHEFTYDNGYYDKQIAKLGKEISEIHLQLAKYNRLSTYGKRAKAEWKKRTVIALNEKTKDITELKAFRKMCDQQITSMAYITFKNVVREELGEEKYQYLLTKALNELEAYKTSGLMRHEYTRSNSLSNVTNINKL